MDTVDQSFTETFLLKSKRFQFLNGHHSRKMKLDLKLDKYQRWQGNLLKSDKFHKIRLQDRTFAKKDFE